MPKKRKILVTSALPYANGPIHIGHLVEYIQTDVWVRYQRFAGNQAWYFCADDTHGTPVMLAAKKEGITPEELVRRTHAEHLRDLSAFQVAFDNYYTTHSEENRWFAEDIYKKALKNNHIQRKSIQQLYCPKESMFLPDRFVKGECPKCAAKDQYGDSCEVCGSTYNPKELKNPYCASCSAQPVEKESEHLFFRLSDFKEFLEKWIETPGRVDPAVLHKMQEWLGSELRDWDISRDAPYFGFAIPGEKDRFFYVWLDAPIGYMASSKNYFESKGQLDIFDDFWKKGTGEVYHFIGKDIVYFHTLFWPALLHAGGYRSPAAVFVHGFLTVNGEKMSKSRGTLIKAETYLRYLDPQALRYFYASRLAESPDDIDLAVTDFVNRYNSEVVGNFANIFSRLAGGLAGKLEHTLSAALSKEGEELRGQVLDDAKVVLAAYENRTFSKAVRQLAAAGDRINKFVNDREPWKTIAKDKEGARQVITDALTAGRILAGIAKPVLPVFSAGVEELLALPAELSADNLKWVFPANHEIRTFRHLAARLDPADVEKMLEHEKKDAAAKAAPAPKTPGAAKAEAPSSGPPGIISVDDLGKVELRVGRIVSAGLVEGADRLLSLEVDLGDAKPRRVFAGIRGAYKPEDINGLMVVAVANLAPRKMKFGVSEAMLLASGEGDDLTLFVPHRTAKPGDRLK